jgi:restriction system protein
MRYEFHPEALAGDEEAARDPKVAASSPDAVRVLASEFRLSGKDRQALLPSGGTLVFASRVSWACTYLKKAGLLHAPRRGFFQITDRGLKVLKSDPARIDNSFLDRFDEFREFRSRGRREPRSKGNGEDLASSSDTPDEAIAAQYELQRKALALRLLDTVKSSSPQFFERLVVTLLVKMGYGGSLQGAGSAVGRSGDGGVDGVIKEDKLGLDTLYILAKRWDNKRVGSPQIAQFAGALQKKKAHKGVFVTTSCFTADALNRLQSTRHGSS